MPFIRHHFQFFANREITSLYVMIALVGFAEGLMSIFVPVYFWKLGFSFPRILFFYFLASVFFIGFTFLLLPLIRKLSDKVMMLFSVPFLIAYYLGLSSLSAFPGLFYLLPAAAAVAALLFNVGYHVDFSGSADDGYIGREVGGFYMVASLAQFAAPLVGGFLIAVFGFQNNFFIGSAILVVAILPLFLFPGRRSSEGIRWRAIVKFLLDRDLAPFTASGFGYAIESSIARVIWPLFIFLVVGSIEEFGGIVSVGLFGGAVATYFVGFLSDHGRRRKLLAVCSVAFSFLWMLRPFFMHPFAVVANHVGGNIVNASLAVTWGSQYYKIARSFPAPILFILSREVLYHVARVLVLPIFIYLSYALPRDWFFTVSFLAAAFFTLFYLFANRFHLHRPA